MPLDGAFAFVMIPVRDLNRAQKFYATIFSWNFISKSGNTPGPRIFMTGGDVMGGLMLCDAPPASEGSRIVTFVKVRDMAGTVAKAVAAGGKVRKAPYRDVNNELAEIEDTEGNVMGLLRYVLS